MQNFWTPYRNLLIWIVVGVLILGMLFPADDPIHKWLQEWSTLIAGMLAVAAAVFTIGQMSRSDRASERRHQQTMDLAQRRDRLMVLREATPIVPAIDVLKPLIVDFDNDMNGREIFEGISRDDPLVFQVLVIAQRMKQIAEHLEKYDAKDLHDPELTWQIAKFDFDRNLVQGRAEAIFNERAATATALYPSMMSAILGQSCAAVAGITTDMIDHLDDMKAGFERMIRLYQLRSE